MTALILSILAQGNDWTLYNKGIRWQPTLKKAGELAARDKKLVFYFQVVGNLSQRGC